MMRPQAVRPRVIVEIALVDMDGERRISRLTHELPGPDTPPEAGLSDLMFRVNTQLAAALQTAGEETTR